MFMYIHVPLYHLFPDTQNRVKRQDNNNIYIKTHLFMFYSRKLKWGVHMNLFRGAYVYFLHNLPPLTQLIFFI